MLVAYVVALVDNTSLELSCRISIGQLEVLLNADLKDLAKVGLAFVTSDFVDDIVVLTYFVFVPATLFASLAPEKPSPWDCLGAPCLVRRGPHMRTRACGGEVCAHGALRCLVWPLADRKSVV